MKQGSAVAVPPAALKFLAPLAARAREWGLPLYAVGGCVRDWLLGRATYDLDLVCEGDPAPLAALYAERWGGRAESFGRFGTLRVLSPGFRVDFARSRRERYPEPASLPLVEPAPLLEDLRRRDFTINAMAAALDGGARPALIDPLAGAADLEAGVLRPIHAESFRDDPTRVFRGARYACRLDLKPAPDFSAMAREALARGHAARLSRHRLFQELLRILGEAQPDCALRRLGSWGYLDLIDRDLKPPPKAAKTPWGRLGAIAASMGAARGREFLASLPIERAISGPLAEALSALEQRRAPARELPSFASEALRAAAPKLPRAALKARLLRGDDLKEAGLKPGPAYKRILDDVARAQWQGKLTSRRQARAWLKSALKRPASRRA